VLVVKKHDYMKIHPTLLCQRRDHLKKIHPSLLYQMRYSLKSPFVKGGFRGIFLWDILKENLPQPLFAKEGNYRFKNGH
jgi:hypothetical protein